MTLAQPLVPALSTAPSAAPSAARPTARITRCCDGHHDRDLLCVHLIRDFPDLPPRLVARELDRALTAVQWLLHTDDGLVTTELIVRNQLLLMTGERADHAHLDPQHHPQRSRPA